MAITNVDVNRLNEPKYAQYCIVNGCDAKTRCQIASIHGADKVKVWESVDSTKYEIADEDYNKAYDAGKQNVKDSVGYDGHKSYRAVGDAATSVGGQVGAYFLKKGAKEVATTAAEKGIQAAATKSAEKAASKIATKTAKKTAEKAGAEAGKAAGKEGAKGLIGGIVQNTASKAAAKAASKKAAEVTSQKMAEGVSAEAAKAAGKEAGEKAGQEAGAKVAQGAGKSIGCIIGCVLGLAEGTKYTLSRPNKDQVDAAGKLQSEQLPTSQGELESAQADMLAASEEVMDLTEEANDANEEANEQIEDDKTLLDFYRKQYEALKAKAEAAKNGGTPLTPDEKTLMQKLAPMMEDMSEDINNTNEDASGTVNELYDQIEGYQANYDDGAETIAQVEAVTDYAEGFDSNTEVMCYVEGGVQTLNAASSAKSSYEAFALASSGSWAFGATAWAYAFGVMGATGAALSGKGAVEQFKWAGDVHNEIDVRKDTQDLGNVTNEVYETELDSFAGNMEVVEDLEIEIPEDLEVPDTSDVGSLTAENPTPVNNGEDKNVNPFANTTPDDTKDTKDDDKDDKKKNQLS